jgi:hypothetical protein
MKTTRFTTILRSSLIACALTIGTLASTQTAAAQSGNAVALADIPFTFQSGNAHMPAGEYKVIRTSDHLILLRGPANTTDFVIVNDTASLTAPTKGKLVFHRYGDKYFLREIWTEGSTNGLQCPKSRAEKESQRETLNAQNQSAPSTIELAFEVAPQR